MAQLKDHLATLSKPGKNEEGETRLEREFNVRVWLHVHTCIQYVCMQASVYAMHICA